MVAEAVGTPSQGQEDEETPLYAPSSQRLVDGYHLAPKLRWEKMSVSGPLPGRGGRPQSLLPWVQRILGVEGASFITLPCNPTIPIS